MRLPFGPRDPGMRARLQTIDEQDRYEFIVRQHLETLRRRLRRRNGRRSANPSQRRAADRHARDQSRKLKKKLLANRRPMNKAALLVKHRHSRLLDGLDPRRETRWKNFGVRKLRQKPYHMAFKSFNFLEDPIGTMDQIAKLSEAECNELEIRLDFNDDYCLDAGAFLVLADFWNQLSPVIRSGRMSAPIQKVVSATGIDEDIRIQLDGVRNHNDVWAYPIQRRRPKFSTRDEGAQLNWQERESIADQLVGSFDEWVGVPTGNPKLDHDKDSSGWELSDIGKQNISAMVGEVLCNAERHSQPGSDDGDWSVMGFMARRDGQDGKKTHQCFLAFLSVGQSMAESLTHADPKVRAFVDKYVAGHRNSGMSAATLATVAALQDRVTGDPDAYADGRGGTGLQDVIDFADDLAGGGTNMAKARVTIVSGKSCIRLKPPILKGRRDDSTKPRYQWCNAANDPNMPPDRDIVFDMPRYFAGTLVTVAFTLDLSLERDEAEGNDDADD